MLPEHVPVLTSGEILISDKDFFNDKQDKASPMGWCKLLFLMPQAEHNVFTSSTAADQKDYQAAEAALKTAMGFKRYHTCLDMIEWESLTTPMKQAQAFNKAMKSLGYTQVSDK